MKILTEATSLEDLQDRIVQYRSKLAASSNFNNKEYFKSKPYGIIITDSYNNIAFPFDEPKIDNGRRLSLPLIIKQYIAKYSKNNQMGLLPWHYVIEFYNRDYFIFNTRPINLRYPLNSEQVKTLNIKYIDDKVIDFLNRKNRDVSQYIHIMIIGDSNTDVYTNVLYRKIAKIIIHPMYKLYKFSPKLNQGIFTLNIGKKFYSKLLGNYAR